MANRDPSLKVPAANRWRVPGRVDLHLVAPAVITLVLVAAYLGYIRRYGVNVPFWDEWNLGKLVLRQANGELALFELLIAKHNEHLMGAAFALMLLHHAVTDFNSKTILYLSAALQFAALAVFVGMGWRLLPGGWRRGWYALLIALPLLSLAPAWNILWGFQTAWYLITFFLLAALWFLSRAVAPAVSDWRLPVALGALCAALASFSSVQGLAVWLAGAVFLYVALGGGWATLRDRCMVSWLTATCATGALYAWLATLTPATHSTTKGVAALIAADPLALLRFVLAMGSTVWGDRVGAWAPVAGGVTWLLIVTGLTLALTARNRKGLAMPIALMIFGVAFALMVAIGRLRLGPAAAIESRYSSYLLLAVAGSVLALTHLSLDLDAPLRGGTVRGILVALVVGPFVSAALIGLQTGRQWRVDRGVAAVILLDAERQARFKIERTLCWNADIVLQQVPFLRGRSLSTFAEGMRGIPKEAMPYAAPPPAFLALIERWPAHRDALDRLWDVYVVGPDLRGAFPVQSASMPVDLIGWAAGAARGQHYLSPRLADFASEYERLRDELANPPQ